MNILTRIGLEIHAELWTESKLFCSCPNQFGQPPNRDCCPICMGYPGTLPRVNEKAVELAIRAGLATHCNIAPLLQFDRKNYTYPDLPKGYQITQFFHPLCTDGFLQVGDSAVRIRQIHLEEDAGKLLHGKEHTEIDFNRCGVPLIEMVTYPDLRTPAQTVEFLKEWKLLLSTLHISDGKMQEGSLRVDVNLSLEGEDGKRTARVELKNLSSFSAVAKAIAYEEERQKALLLQDEMGQEETRRWDEKQKISVYMRSKESTSDYRYFPEPDIPGICLSDAWVNDIAREMPETPKQKRERYQRIGLQPSQIESILQNEDLRQWLDSCLPLCQKPEELVKFLLGDFARFLSQQKKFPGSTQDLLTVFDLLQTGKISRRGARAVLEQYNEKQGSVLDLAHPYLLCGEEEIQEAVSDVRKRCEKAILDYQAGKDTALQYLVGETLKQLQGRGEYERVLQAWKKELS